MNAKLNYQEQIINLCIEMQEDIKAARRINEKVSETIRILEFVDEWDFVRAQFMRISDELIDLKERDLDKVAENKREHILKLIARQELRFSAWCRDFADST